jgi:hypothetical protein
LSRQQAQVPTGPEEPHLKTIKPINAMKRFVILCLLGMATFMQTNAGNPVAPALSSTQKAVECTRGGISLYANSDTEDGRITLVEIFNAQYQLVLVDEFYSYSVQVAIGTLKAGNYTAKVYTEYSPVYTYPFNR